MKFTALAASILLPFVQTKTASELCSGTAELSKDGNWYCSEVWAITYRNISQSGVYNRTTYVDPRTGLCGHERLNYPGTGPLTPLFGDVVSMHLRGPMNVSQLAVYQLPSDARKLQRRNAVPFYNRWRALEQRQVSMGNININKSPQFPEVPPTPAMGERTWGTSMDCSAVSTVTTTIIVSDCQTALPTANIKPLQNTTYAGPPLPCLPTSETTRLDINVASTHNLATLISNCTCKDSTATIIKDSGSSLITITTPSPVQKSSIVSERNDVQVAAAAWSRVAYYTSAAPAQATGLSFLANLGDPQKSGTFDYAFGNSLSYVTPNGGRVASESMPFEGSLETSELEIAVFSDKECDGDCPYWRPDTTSHYGWSGSSKAFLIEFQMDHYPNRGSDQGLISDAPALWFLNAAIPRILQYGNDRNNIPCSCWSTGCGEFDAFEVLGNGEERAKSTLHRQGNLQGGDSNYFRRPVGKKLKFAVVWHFPHITVRMVDEGFEFGERLTEEQVRGLVEYHEDSWVHSLFAIGE